MEFEIRKQEARPLLKMTEIEARMTFEGATPTKQAVVQSLAARLKTKPELVIVHEIRTTYGEQSAIVFARAYADRQALELVEHESMVKKHAFADKKSPSTEKPAEKPAQEAKSPATEKPAPEDTGAEKPAEAAKESATRPAEKAAEQDAKPEEKAAEHGAKPAEKGDA